MDQEVIQLLKKYIANNCSAAELEKVDQIIRSGTFGEEWAHVMEEEAALDMADDHSSAPEHFDAEKVFHKINIAIKPARKFRIHPWLTGIAAALVLTLSITFLFLHTGDTDYSKATVLKLVSPAGKQEKITLSDGTQVTLNCGSTLTYTSRFGEKKREVYLEGEAFFNVKHDDHKPFLVHSDRLHVQVLGTSFNVRAYRSDKKTTVSVASGKVGVNNHKKSATYMLLPGDLLSYNQDNEFKKDKIKAEDILAWQKGILLFRLETIREIAPVLERFYGVSINIQPASASKKQITASFTQKTLPQVLEILSQTAGFTYVIHKNQVSIN